MPTTYEYEKPQVKVFQSFTEVPTATVGNQPAFVFGPEYTLFRYSEEHDICVVTDDKGDAIPYAGTAISLEYPKKVTSVDTTWEKSCVYAEDADYNTGDGITVYDIADLSSVKLAGGYAVDAHGVYYKLKSTDASDALVAGQYLGLVADGGVVLAKYINAGSDSSEYKYIVRLGTQLSGTFPLDVTVHEFKESYAFPSSAVTFSASSVSIDAASDTTGDVVRAERLYVQFRAPRYDHAKSIDHVESIPDVGKVVGQIDPANPLAYGVYMAKLNSGKCPVYFLGTRGTDKQAFMDALRKASLTSDIYALVPMSDDQEVFDVLEAHIKEMSSEETKMWRIGWISAPVDDEVYIHDLNGKRLQVALGPEPTPTPPGTTTPTIVTLDNGETVAINKSGTITVTDIVDAGLAELGVGDVPQWTTRPVAIDIGTSVTAIGDHTFSGASDVTSLTIPNTVRTIGDDAFGMFTALTEVSIPESVVSIGAYAFASSGLTSVIIPDSVTTVGESAFLQSMSLHSATIGRNVTEIPEGMFDACTSLASIVIPQSVTSIGAIAFKNCDALTSIAIPPSVTTIGSGAFEGSSLSHVLVAEGDGLRVDSMIEDSGYSTAGLEFDTYVFPPVLIPTLFPYFVDANGDIDTSVRAQDTLHNGDVITFTDKTTATVVSIPSNTRIEIDHALDDPTGIKTIESVLHVKTGSQIAEDISRKSESFSNRRIYNTFPSVLHVTVNGETRDVPGYYGAAAAAGLCSSTLPQQPLTNMDIEGIHDVPETYLQFDNTELNVMASGGTFIITQDMPYDRVYVRHQLSTATHEGNLLTRELSITKNVDSISYYLAETCDDLIGKYNITPELLRVVELRLRTAIDWLENNTDNGLYGPQLLEEGTEIISVAEHPVLKDHVQAYIVLNPPKPFNVLEIHLTVI